MLNLPLDQLPDPLPLPHPKLLAQGATARIRPPGSKSLTNRALVLAAIADGPCVLRHPLTEASDAQAMLECVRQLGAKIEIGEDEVRVESPWAQGRSGFTGGQTLDCRSAGTASRFLTAIGCLADGPTTITGSDQLRARPFGEQVAMLRDIGVAIEGEKLPLKIEPIGKMRTNTVTVGRTASSQFISALLMLATRLPEPLTIEFAEPPTSRSYIDMTCGLLKKLGGRVDASATRITVHNKPVGSFDYPVEADASGATYFLAANHLIKDSSVEVEGVPGDSLQGDAAFRQMLVDVMNGANPDMTDMPDAAMTLAAFVVFADGPTTMTGLRTLRDKECDRISATKAELQKLGARVEVFDHESRDGGPDEGMTIHPPEGGIECSESAPAVEFDTYDDHRMAMSTALIALRRPNVLIRDPGCVAKTYPGFWRDFARLYAP